MPTFCRHNRLIQNCSICAREQAIEPRPLVSSGAPRASAEPAVSARTPARPVTKRPATNPGRRPAAGLRVRRLARGNDDGYRSALVVGLRSSQDADRLAQELAFAGDRLARLSADPPGLYAEVADSGGDVEERTWLAFLIAYLCPLERPDPFASIAKARTAWHSGQPPDLNEIELGPRSAHRPERGTRSLDAYRAWAQRAGSQQSAFTGEPAWASERRFARVYERLALPGLSRDVRYELLVVLGGVGLYELKPATLALGGDNEVTVAAKRALGIGDPLLLERRAQALAEACGLPLGALDLGLYNWERGTRVGLGLESDRDLEPGRLAITRQALGLQ